MVNLLRPRGGEIRVDLWCPSAIQWGGGWTLSLSTQNEFLRQAVLCGNTLTIRSFLRCWLGREFPWIDLNYLVIELNTLRM